MPAIPKEQPQRNERKPTQARGRVRRQLLIQTAKDLLDQRPLESISLADVAEQAGIPTASAYHFFPSINAVFAALTDRFGEELDAAIRAPYAVPADANWSNILDQAIERACTIYEASPAYRQLIIGGRAPAEIKLSDRDHDEEVGRLLFDAIDQRFVVPDIPRANQIFFHTVEIVDLFYMLSMIRDNRITAEMTLEAKRAAYSYLRSYLPAELSRRSAESI